MSKLKYDVNDNDFIIGNDNMGIDSDGHINMDTGNNLSIDLDDGDIHFTIGENEDEG